MKLIKNYINSQVYEDIKYILNAKIDWDSFSNKTILITGANGFIAYYLVLAFLVRNDLNDSNIKVKGLVRKKDKAIEKYKDIVLRDDFEIIEQDVCKCIEEIGHTDFVIHAASQASPYFFENDPVGTLEANTTGTTNILKYAVKEKPDAVLMISSLKVYGTLYNGQAKIKEEDMGYLDISSYKNCYAMGKRTMETLCSSYYKQYGINIKIARPSYIYGASTLEDDRVWAQFLANIIKNEDILLRSDGMAYRSFCYVADTVTALLTIMLKGENALPYNISAEHSNTTIRNFAKKATEAFKEKEIKLKFANKQDEKEPELDAQSTTITPEVLDNKRLKELGWEGNINLMNGIRRAVNTMLEN